MKKKILQYKSVVLVCLAVLGMTSCSDWLDVKPKTEVEAEEMFSTENGFKEALAGAYTMMNQPKLYGREMTFGLVDAVAQQWKIGANDNNHTYYDAARYEYDAVTIKPKIDTIWSAGYNLIANVNSILKFIDEKASVFTGDNKDIIKGEALAIRAYMHFDLLRLFGKDGISTDANDGIPYVSEISKQITRSVSPKEVIENVITDLNNAIQCLKVDPILTGRQVSVDEDGGYLINRQYHLNYYAAVALLARVQLYAGMSEARNNAMIVIDAHEDSNKFPWVEPDVVTTKNTISKDRVFSSELLFTLHSKKMVNNIKGYFTSTDNPLKTRLSLVELFNGVPELRSYLFETIDQKNDVPSKLRQMDAATDVTSGQYSTPVRDRMPMIRISEMYYIVAECDKDNATNAVEELNKVLTGRGYEAQNLLNPSVVNSVPAVLEELLKEYEREFICEGQLFFFHKRHNTAMINNQEVKYQFPKPDVEIEFGK